MSRIPTHRTTAQPSMSSATDGLFRRASSVNEFKRTSTNTNMAPSAKRQRTDAPSARARTSVAGVRRPLSNLQPVKENIRPGLAGRASATRESMPALRKVKRPAWDLKGRIQDMEEKFHLDQVQKSDLEQKLNLYNNRIIALETANSQLHQDVEIKSVQSEEATSRVCNLQSALKQKTEELETVTRDMQREISQLKGKLEAETGALEQAKLNYDNLKKQYDLEVATLKDTISNITLTNSGIETQLISKDAIIAKNNDEIYNLKAYCEAKDNENAQLKQEKLQLESKLRQDELERRKLHNTVQELKGNIRVFCRIRPPLPHELENGMRLAHLVLVNEKMLEVQQLLPESSKSSSKHEFSFDNVFPTTATQDGIFEEISQLVQSSLDGYNVSIFAYGQTGSGKTYTMEGPECIIDFLACAQDPRLGMIPRSVQQVFATISRLEAKGWKYVVEATFLEIYNERIRDLLRSARDSSSSGCKIKKSAGGGANCLLSNVNTEAVTSTRDVYELLKRARMQRAVAATKCNENSSRSHYVFQMKLNGENSITGDRSEGTLNLIDLAGSERIKESESSGERLVEAKAINKSLSNLGKVILSLSRKENHVPYRDSKLTQLLANSLGGNSKTLMFVNISPDNENFSETINSLRFATMVNQCNIGTAQRKMK